MTSSTICSSSRCFQNSATVSDELALTVGKPDLRACISSLRFSSLVVASFTICHVAALNSFTLFADTCRRSASMLVASSGQSSGLCMGFREVASENRLSRPGSCCIVKRHIKVRCFRRNNRGLVISKQLYERFVVGYDDQFVTSLRKIPGLFERPSDGESLSFDRCIACFSRTQEA